MIIASNKKLRRIGKKYYLVYREIYILEADIIPVGHL